ncbi:hypothetical protein HaLaN_01345, partial [Haematococcus lacustris]
MEALVRDKGAAVLYLHLAALPCPYLCPWWAGWACLPAEPWCACCAWLASECWAQALRLLAVWLPGYMGAVAGCRGPPSGTTSGPALAGHVAGSRLGGAGGGPPALLELPACRPGGLLMV